MTCATMQLNNDLNGVELYFDNKPAQEVLSTLKSNGFRWSGFKKCWYAKQKENTLKLAEELTGSDIPTTEETTITAGTKTATKQTKSTLPLFERVQFEKGTADTNKYNFRFVGSNYTGLSVKETAAIIRKHLKSQFPEIKFSITSSHNKIDITIKEAPYENLENPFDSYSQRLDWREFKENNNRELKAILQYCQSLLDSYNYDDSDTMSDYFHNHYYDHVSIDYDYTQTEQTEVTKEDITNFRTKLQEEAQAEEERKEKEYQEQLKQREEDNKKYEIRQQQEANQKEVINNSVNIIELDESKQYFVIGSEFARLDKNNTLTEYQEQVEKGEFYTKDVKITKELHFQSAEALQYYSNLLMSYFDFLAGKGGSYTEDTRVNSMTDFYNMTSEERESIIWIEYGFAVYYNNELQFIINNEGHQYARSIGLVKNAKIKKTLPIIQLVNNEEITALKEKAESLIDFSTEVITDLNLVKTWNTDNWTEYKEALKTKLYTNKFKLTKAIIQQIEDQEELKTAMYKLLIEVDGIQEQFKNADLQQGQKITLVYMSDFGGIITRKVTLDKAEPTTYAQYNNAVKLTYKPSNKRKLYYSYHYSTMLVYNGWQELPETVLNTIEQRDGFIITKGKYSSCDNRQLDEVLNYFETQGIKPTINTYKPTF